MLAANSHRIVLRCLLPCVVAPLRRLPALCLFPGHTPAHEARCFAEGKRVMSGPISASIAAAATGPVTGSVSKRRSASSSPLVLVERLRDGHLHAMNRPLHILDVVEQLPD
jgi:hypothetical protein